MASDPLAVEVQHATDVVAAHPAWCLERHAGGPGANWSSLPFRSGVEIPRDRLLARSMLLTQGAQRARADANTYVLVLCAQGHIETIGSLAQLVLKLSRLRTGKLDSQQWKDALRRLLGGAKSDLGDGITIEPFNVLSLVDAIAEALKLAGVPGPSHLRESYDLASEWAHPNAGGTSVDWHGGMPQPNDVVIDAQWITLGSSITGFQRLMDYLDGML